MAKCVDKDLKGRSSQSQMDGAFTLAAIEADLSWVPDTLTSGEHTEKVHTYIQAYLTDPDSWHWSTDLHNEPRHFVLKRVLAIIARASVTDHKKTLGQLGVGPLENLISDELLDNLQPWMPFSPAMCYALSMVRMTFEPVTLQQRLNTMLQLSDLNGGR